MKRIYGEKERELKHDFTVLGEEARVRDGREGCVFSAGLDPPLACKTKDERIYIYMYIHLSETLADNDEIDHNTESSK